MFVLITNLNLLPPLSILGIKLYGAVILTSFTQSMIPSSSCLTIYIQEALSCNTAAGTGETDGESLIYFPFI